MIHEICQRLITVQAAQKQGLDTLPVIVKEREYLRHKTAKSVVLRDRYDIDWLPSDSAIKAYYDNHIDDYVFERNYHVEYILSEDSVFAEFIRDQIVSGFQMKNIYESDLVQTSGVEVSYEDLGYIREVEVDSVFYQWVLRTPIKFISKPFPWKGGYCLINIVEKKENVLLIPNGAIKGSRGDYWTEVVIDEATLETEKRSITIGVQNALFAEILSGLNEGEKVIVEKVQSKSRSLF